MVAELMLSGASRLHIQAELAPKWGVDRRTIRTYMAEVERQWRAAEKEIDPVLERQRLRERFELVFRGCVVDREWSPAVNLLKQMARLLPGFEAPLQVQHTGPGGGPVQLDITKLDLSGLSDTQLDALQVLGPELPRLFLMDTTAEPAKDGKP